MQDERQRKGMPAWAWVLIILAALGVFCCVGGGLFLKPFIKAGIQMGKPFIVIDAHMAQLRKDGYTVLKQELQDQRQGKHETTYIVTSPEGEVTEYKFGFDVDPEQVKDAKALDVLKHISIKPLNEPARRLWQQLDLPTPEPQ